VAQAAVAVLVAIIRSEEKAIFRALDSAGLPFEKVDVRSLIVSGDDGESPFRLILNRSISQTSGRHAVAFFEGKGAHCLNQSRTIDLCGNKALTAMTFAQHAIACPRWRVAFDPESALTAIVDLGFPVVVKPVVGSWGRLIARVDDLNAAESIIEHKKELPGSQNGVFFLQEYIEKPQRDVRVLALDHEPIAAYARYSAHWKTNVKRGATTEKIETTREIRELTGKISRAVGGGFIAIDFLECPRRGLLANEVNHTPEFQGAIEATAIDIAGLLGEYIRQSL